MGDYRINCNSEKVYQQKCKGVNVCQSGFPELVNKNIPKQINTIVNRDSNPEEPRVLALEDLVSVATSSQIQSIDKPR